MLKGRIISLFRLFKDYISYDKELKSNEEKLSDLKNSNAEERLLNKQEEYNQETREVLNSVLVKLKACLEQLTELLNEVNEKNDNDILQLVEYQAAVEHHKNANDLIQNLGPNN